VGQRRGVERELAVAAGMPFKAVSGGKFRRNPRIGWRNLLDFGTLFFNIRDLLLIAIGTAQSLWILGRFRPDAMFNKAGPTGIPMGLAARLLGIPMLIHEPDVVPGLGNRILSRWASAIATGFPADLYRQFPQSRMHYTGNPVRPEIRSLSKQKGLAQWGFHPSRPVVLIMGGSQGAVRVNNAVLDDLHQLIQDTQVLHITGQKDAERAGKEVAKQGIATKEGYKALPYITAEEIALAYAAADVVVSRAGANTIAELAALGKPAILIPNAAMAAHQLVNAQRLAKADAVILLPEEELGPGALAAVVSRLLGKPADRRKLSQAISSFNKPDAADRMANLLLQATQPGEES
jgi:UDP-N-acetylglucosamine--N-acetylmuramyl-(pentapeptide) pyrophosphoryl-undecaprenol N-acetylglucosamine transferase